MASIPTPGLSRAAVDEVPPAVVPSDPGSRSRPSRLGVLDGLRLIAAFTVMCYHYVAQGDYAWNEDAGKLFPVADGITAYGWLGVELFFVISGFVICMSAWGRRAGDFLVSRVVRLYPAYWFAIGLITLAVTISPVLQTRLVSSEILVNLTMLQYPVGLPGASSVFWTLWNELHFYVLFGIAVAGRATYRRVLGFCGFWILAAVFAEQMQDRRVSILVDQRYAPFFVAGILLYLMYRFRPNPMLWGMFGVSWALAMLNTVGLTKSAEGAVGHKLDWRPSACIVTGCFVVVAAAVLWPRLARIQARWLTVAGALTYPLYLIHLELGWLVIRVAHRRVDPWPLLLSVVAGMLLLAYLINRLVERPASRLLNRWLRLSLAQMRDVDRPSPPASSPTSPPVIVYPYPGHRVVQGANQNTVRARIRVRRAVRTYREEEERRPRVTTAQRGPHS